jgi:hypothetical protein
MERQDPRATNSLGQARQLPEGLTIHVEHPHARPEAGTVRDLFDGAEAFRRKLGGSGQWMAGGPIMISDMFNNALKARVDALCNELSALIRSEPDFAAADSFQLQSQRTRDG